jgi:hypothetical protein
VNLRERINMANNQDCPMENGEDFSQDVSADQNFGQNQQDQVNGQNGSGDAPPADSGSADAPGRDDDRYVPFPLVRVSSPASNSKFLVLKPALLRLLFTLICGHPVNMSGFLIFKHVF